ENARATSANVPACTQRQTLPHTTPTDSKYSRISLTEQILELLCGSAQVLADSGRVNRHRSSGQRVAVIVPIRRRHQTMGRRIPSNLGDTYVSQACPTARLLLSNT